MLSTISVGSVSALACSLNLPNELVTLDPVNPNGIESFFLSTLSNVPLGDYDVTDGEYLGWCVDRSHLDLPSLNLNVTLISSCDIPSTYSSEEWYSEDWNRVNWILNNKPAGITSYGVWNTVRTEMCTIDIQLAIWYFVDNQAGNFMGTSGWPFNSFTQQIIDDAMANGGTFVPQPGDVVAVICIPESQDQITIIEVEVPEEEEGPEGLTPGFWKNHPLCWDGYEPTQYFNDVFDVSISIGNGKKAAENPTLMEALNANGGGINALARHAVAALLNAAHPDVNYPLSNTEIINAVHEAIANGEPAITDLKDQLDMYNNLGGGIDAHGNPI